MKTVLITGANKGIGFETARQLAQKGYLVYLGSRDKQRGTEAVQQLNAQGITNIEAIELDVTSKASVESAVNILNSKIDALDVLINNAAISGIQQQNFTECDIDEVHRVFETNYFGVILVTQLMLPLLRKAEAPAIINVSSELSSLTLHTSPERNSNYDNYSVYGASKTALNGFSVALANELRHTNFRVNSVTPGYTATDLNQFQGSKTVEQGAKAIVDLAINVSPGVTAKFFNDGGEVPW